MEQTVGILSLLPALVAIVLAFATRDALFSLLVGVVIGIIVLGENLITGFSGLFQEALGTPDFIWVLMIEVFIGIMVAFFQKSGAINAFSEMIGKYNLKRRGAQVLAWLLGIFIFFSDYFSPLYVGTVMRDVTDKARVSREKLAYICDSTSAPVISTIPFSSWAIYLGGILVGIGPFVDTDVAMNAMIHMVPFNFYGLLSVVMVGLITLGILPDFGPMKAAEERTIKTGKVMNDDANPLLGKELEGIKPNPGIKPNLVVNFFLPAVIVISITLGTYIAFKSALILEAFIVAVAFQFVCILVQKMATVTELMEVTAEGIKSVLGAILILSLAYALNAISAKLGTAQYVVSITEQWMTPALLLFFAFVISGFIAFFTGTSWGTYAIVTPMIIPLALNASNGQIDTIVYASIAAIMGGGVFGDHCSPLSDTTILSSLAAGSDHIDHVKTQWPYAFTVAGIAAVLYVIVGITY